MSLQTRLRNEVSILRERRATLNTELQYLDGLISTLDLLTWAGDDAQLEDILTRLCTAVPPVEVPPTPAPPPPPTKRIHITCDGIYALTQTFQELFTLNNIVDALCDAEGVTDPAEKVRVRSAVYTMLRKLCENGRLLQPQKGTGKKQGLYQRMVRMGTRIPPFKDGPPEPIEIEHIHTATAVQN